MSFTKNVEGRNRNKTLRYDNKGDPIVSKRNVERPSSKWNISSYWCNLGSLRDGNETLGYEAMESPLES